MSIRKPLALLCVAALLAPSWSVAQSREATSAAAKERAASALEEMVQKLALDVKL